jgi:two-component system OmpR family sensor kinase
MVKSLRWRLQIWHAIVLTGVLTIFGTVVYSLHWQTRMQQIDAELDRMAEVLGARLRRLLPFPGPPPRGLGRPSQSIARSSDGHLRPEFPRPHRDELHRDETHRDEMHHNIIQSAIERLDRPEMPEMPTTVSEQTVAEAHRTESRRPESRRSESRRGDGSRADGGRGERPGRPPWERRGAERLPPGLGLPEEFQHLFEGEDESRFYFVIWGHEGVVLEKSSLAPDVPYPDLHMGEDTLPVRQVRLRDNCREVTHVSRYDVNVLVGRSISNDLLAEHRYGALLFLAGTGVLTAGFLGGGWLSARAIRPISSMTATAQSISAQNLTQRIDLQDTATELGQLAVVLNGTFDRLQAAFEQQSRFTADASHELRTPLAVILAHTELALSRLRSPEEYRTALQTCQRASSRMKSLIEGLLMLARFDSKRAVLETTEFELAHVVFECVELLQPLAEARRIQIGTELEPTRIRADRSRISQVITNLLTNAIRYNHDDGSVKITIVQEHGEISLRVSDTGLGIPADELPHIFERFYRVDKARTRTEGGSGLGLSICKTIVEAHGGVIHVSSEPQLGTLVEVRLPIEVINNGT